MGFGIGHSEGEKYGKEDWDEDERTVELIAHNFNLENMLAVHTAALPDWAELGDYRSMEAYALREQKAENREQKAEIREQKARNAKLTAENTRLKKKLATLRT
jgi:cell division protein FtsB